MCQDSYSGIRYSYTVSIGKTDIVCILIYSLEPFMKKLILITTTTVAAACLLSGCSSLVNPYKEPSIDVLKTVVPSTTAAPSASPSAVTLPTQFPKVPLFNDDYVPGSYKTYMNTAAQQEYKVSLYADEQALTQIIANYQVSGFQPTTQVTNPDGSKTVEFDNSEYSVTVNGKKNAENRYQYDYRIVTKAVN
jgi:hypothetical protein